MGRVHRIDSCSVVKGQGSYAYIMRATKLISLVSISSRKMLSSTDSSDGVALDVLQAKHGPKHYKSLGTSPSGNCFRFHSLVSLLSEIYKRTFPQQDHLLYLRVIAMY